MKILVVNSNGNNVFLKYDEVKEVAVFEENSLKIIHETGEILIGKYPDKNTVLKVIEKIQKFKETKETYLNLENSHIFKYDFKIEKDL